MPGTRCAVAICNNNLKSMKGLSFHRFPIHRPDILKVWIEKCRRKDDFNPKTSHICSAHFLQEDFENELRHQLMGTKKKRRLKLDAVPSLLIKPDMNTEFRIKTYRNKKVVKKYQNVEKNLPDDLLEKNDCISVTPQELLKDNNVGSTSSSENLPNIKFENSMCAVDISDNELLRNIVYIENRTKASKNKPDQTNEEMGKSMELEDDICRQILEENIEHIEMQNTILNMSSDLKNCKERIKALENEVIDLKCQLSTYSEDTIRDLIAKELYKNQIDVVVKKEID